MPLSPDVETESSVLGSAKFGTCNELSDWHKAEAIT